MIPGFNAGSLSWRYAFLDECPEHLLEEVITLPVRSLPERVAGARSWRDSLLQGRLPPPDTWPPMEVGGPLRNALEELGLVRFCKDQPELVDALLTDIFAAFARQAEVVRSEILERLQELQELERQRQEEQEVAETHRTERRASMVRFTGASMRRLREQAQDDVALLEREVDPRIIEGWGERVRAWTEIADVFGDLGQMLGRGWDLSLGVLRHSGWLDVVRLRQLLKQLPQLREIIQTLGRLQVSENEPSVAEAIFVPVRRLEKERCEIPTPLVPSETRGIERSGEISRMLPAEAIMLGHPKLRLLWHARRAERALLTYRVEGIEIDQSMVEHESTEEKDERTPRPERGPILAVIDTSGSMHGLPEQVAKALVLEALRTAHAERRRCFLYSFSGPGQVHEQELDLSPDGVGRLLEFLGFSFGGGSDTTEVMTRVIARLAEREWKKADILLVSDGEWPEPKSLQTSIKDAREQGTRFHGVQIGNRGRTGLHALCDPVHVFQDWAAAGGWI